MKIKMHRRKTGDPSSITFDLPEEARSYFVKLFTKGMEKGDVYNVSIELPKKQRSTGAYSQSHHFNGHVQQVAFETGNEFEQTKYAIKLRACDMGYPCIHNKTGDRIPQSEALASVAECILLIEAAHIVAAEMDIKLKED